LRRAFLLTATALGLVISLVGSTGLFAALTDTARTGTNQVTTPGLASSADLKLAMSEGPEGNKTCGDFSDDLATGLFDFTANQPIDDRAEIVCLKNAGSQSLTSLTMRVDELTDVDIDCTGDEQANGDATCGGDAAGELADVLAVSVAWDACPNQAPSAFSPTQTLLESASTPIALPTLGVDEMVCLLVTVAYPATGAPSEALQRAQSDKVTWRFRFDAGT